MAKKINLIPDDMLQILTDASATRPGKCFENCVIAVLGLRISRKLLYVLGFVTPPGYSPVPHAWLGQETSSGLVYLDPTLQCSSKLWQERKDDFVYQQRYSFSREELLEWFRTTYPSRALNEIGIPDGLLMGPTLGASGELSSDIDLHHKI